MLLAVIEPDWNVTPTDAIAMQRDLASQVRLESGPREPLLVAGIDVGIRRDVARAGIAVLSLPELETVETISAEQPVLFPYVPGLLSFREGPVIMDALARLRCVPDVLMFDGQGIAHPRRFGLATHIGILLDHPTVGCAKSRLCGTYDEPDVERGASAALWDKGEQIGSVLRTRTRIKPLFVSVGHRVRLDYAIDLVLSCGGGYKLPEPTRRAHQIASKIPSLSSDWSQ